MSSLERTRPGALSANSSRSLIVWKRVRIQARIRYQLNMTIDMRFLMSAFIVTSFAKVLSAIPATRQEPPTPPPVLTSTSLPALEDTPNQTDPAHELAINRQNSIIATGQNISLAVTNALTTPFVFINNGVSAAVSTLPGILSANGAILGSLIATPIQMGSLAFNSAVTGLTGAFVSFPISLISGGTAHMIGFIESGRELLQTRLFSPLTQLANSTTETPAASNETVSASNETESVSNSTSIRERIEVLLQPLAVAAGSNTVLAGLGLNRLGEGVKAVGQRVEEMGVSLTNAANRARRLSSVLVGWVYGRPLYLNNVDLTQFSPTTSERLNQSDDIPVVASPETQAVLKSQPESKPIEAVEPEAKQPEQAVETEKPKEQPKEQPEPQADDDAVQGPLPEEPETKSNLSVRSIEDEPQPEPESDAEDVEVAEHSSEIELTEEMH